LRGSHANAAASIAAEGAPRPNAARRHGDLRRQAGFTPVAPPDAILEIPRRRVDQRRVGERRAQRRRVGSSVAAHAPQSRACASTARLFATSNSRSK
jgi:hypothetical protein